MSEAEETVTELRETVKYLEAIVKDYDVWRQETRDRVKELEDMVEFNTSAGNLSLLPWNWKD